MYEEYTLVGYGCGKNFYSYLERLEPIINIEYFSDIKESLEGKKIYTDERTCILPKMIKSLSNPLVIILVDEVSVVNSIKSFLDLNRIPYFHAREFLNLELTSSIGGYIKWLDDIQCNKIHRFIDLNITGTTSCNFHCEYCYVWRRQGFQGECKLSNKKVEELVHALSLNRTGGVCFINMCARGETLLADGIFKLIGGLLEEGHFVSIVTNATITKQINDILSLPDELLERLFFKISFHYKELKRLSMFDLFWNNVKNIKESSCSFTLEVTPGDGTEELIEEMKMMCFEKMEGALPQISFTRDSKKSGYDLLSNHTIEEYRGIWDQFDSKMFTLKSEWYGVNMNKYNCYAGVWSYLVDAVTGDVKACYQQPPIGNIFDNSKDGFPVKSVGKDCAIAYCFNNHAFLAWGNIPEIKCNTYLDMRDRVNLSGKHWVKEPMYSFMTQKLQDNNFEYIDKWPDYEKLYVKNRKKSFILFNSPDYPNIGDHAIAMAERKFFSDFFPEYDFIEISCTQYVRENPRIKLAIKEEDVILISGGGYTGNIYLRLQDITTHIIQMFPKNSIIVCPQTMFFEGGKFCDLERNRIISIYEKHTSLMLVARENRTYNLYESMFSDNIKKSLAPDMAFYLKIDEIKERQGALFCLRDDKESNGKISAYEVKMILMKYFSNVSEFSTISDESVMLCNREGIVLEILNKILKAEIVITDRLHCMIFCVITNTPCIVMDNSTGKVFNVFKTLPIQNIVRMCESIKEINSLIQELIKFDVTEKINFECLDSNIISFSKEIKQFIK